MFKTVLALALLLVVKVLASPLHNVPAYEGTRVIKQESYCAVQGGMCRVEDECRPGDVVRIATLCPAQAHLGVVCCYYF